MNNKENKNIKIDKDAILQLIQKEKRFVLIGVIALFLVIIAIIIGVNGKKETNQKADATGNANIETDEFGIIDNQDIRALIEDYYAAYANSDPETMATLAVPISDNEKEYAKLFGDYVEQYTVNEIYGEKAADKESYLISVDMNIQFKDMKTGAPGLDFFYVQKAEDGTYFINNLYSQFNSQIEEYNQDEDTAAQIAAYEKEDKVVALQKEVQEKYDVAIASDQELDTLVNTTIQKAISTWVSTATIKQYQDPPAIQIAQNDEDSTDQNTDQTNDGNETTDNSATDNSTTDNNTTDNNTTDNNATDNSSTQVQKVKTKDQLYLRKKASKESAILATVPEGTTLKVLGTSANGNWTKVKYQGKTGFLKNTYLRKFTEGTTTSDQPDVGEKFVLTQTINIRAAKSKTSDKVGTAYVGDTVTVISNFDSGWTKVKWRGKKGFILTKLLLEN